MSKHYHAVLWIDHHEARLFHFNADAADGQALKPHDPHVHLHHHAGSSSDGREPEDQAFYRRVADSLAGAKAIMVTGPSTAKVHFFKYAMRHAPALAEAIAAVETVDHPTDRQLLAHARTYFRVADRLLPQRA
jgi:hypothetical protein